MSNSLMPSVMPQLAYDGGSYAAQESVDAAPPMPNPAQMPDTATVPSQSAPDTDATLPQLPDTTLVPAPAQVEHLKQIWLFALLLALLSAATFVAWRYHRRDIASPRRIGRRI